MSLMEKFKNLFTDEEVVEEEEEDTVKVREVKKEEPKEEKKLPTFMREKIEKEEKEKNKLSPQPDFSLNDDNTPQKVSEFSNNFKGNNDEIKTTRLSSNDGNDKNNFKFPMDVKEDEYIETRSRSSRQNMTRSSRDTGKEVHKKEEIKLEKSKSLNSSKKETKVSQLYKDKKPVKKEEEKKFKATPIISPVYGVLDKNYLAKEVTENVRDDFASQRPSKNIDFDSVRKKAYGTLADDIKENLMCENCEYLKEAKECREKRENCKKNKNDGLMYDILNESEDETLYDEDLVQDDITLEDATENYYDYGVEYSPTDTSNNYINEKNDLVINKFDDEKITSDTENGVTLDERPKKKEIPPVKSKINLLSTLKKSAGDVVDDNSTTVNSTSNNSQDKKDLELTDDLFSLIDSMYEERNDQ